MKSKKSIDLASIAKMTDCHLVGNPHHHISDISDLENATLNDASFYSNPRYYHALKHSKAGVIFVDPKTELFDNRNYLISNHPSQAFQELINFFKPQRKNPSGFIGIHSSAVIHPTAELAEGVTIGPHAVIDENVKIGQGTFIGAGAYVGPESVIGSFCTIHPRAVIREECHIGNRVIIQPGAVIGSCGFGYTTDREGKHSKLNQVGNVVIEDDVEIGANTTVDRSRFKSTIISEGSKIDNLVQLGHGVVVGPHNIIISQTGIAGSTTTGRNVVLAGQVAVNGHIHLGDQVTVAGKSGVSKSLPTGKYGGIPAVEISAYNRNQVYLKNIGKFVDKLHGLTARIEKLEGGMREQEHDKDRARRIEHEE